MTRNTLWLAPTILAMCIAPAPGADSELDRAGRDLYESEHAWQLALAGKRNARAGLDAAEAGKAQLIQHVHARSDDVGHARAALAAAQDALMRARASSRVDGDVADLWRRVQYAEDRVEAAQGALARVHGRLMREAEAGTSFAWARERFDRAGDELDAAQMAVVARLRMTFAYGQAESDLAAWEAELRRLEADYRTPAYRLAEARDNVERHRARLAAMQEEAFAADRDVMAARRRLGEAQAALDELRARAAEQIERRMEMKEARAAVDAELHARALAEDDHARARAARERVARDVAAYQAGFDAAQQDVRAAETMLDRARFDLANASAAADAAQLHWAAASEAERRALEDLDRAARRVALLERAWERPVPGDRYEPRWPEGPDRGDRIEPRRPENPGRGDRYDGDRGRGGDNRGLDQRSDRGSGRTDERLAEEREDRGRDDRGRRDGEPRFRQ